MSIYEEYESLKNEVAQTSKEDLPPANVIIAGITGSGKSTLINAVFGENLAETGTGGAVTHRIQEHKKDGVPIVIWDTVGLELKQDVTLTTIEQIKKIITDKSKNKENMYDRVHAIWYCIQSTGHRFQDAEIEFIYELQHLGIPFIVVLTKCISKKKDQEFQDKVKERLLTQKMNVPVVQVLAQEWEFENPVDDSIIILPPKGLDELVNLTGEKLPDFICDSFMAAQKVDKVIKRDKAEDIIVKYCEKLRKNVAVNVVSAIPIISVVDAFVADNMIKKMFKEIGQMYNMQLSEDEIEEIYKYSIGEWKGKIASFLLPFSLSYLTMNKADDFFERKIKKMEGFDNTALKFNYFAATAKLITWSGYSWVIAIEDYWDDLVKEQSEKARRETIHKMVGALRDYMKPLKK